MPIELKNSVRNSVLYLVTASGKCVTSRCQRPGPGACHGICVVIVFSFAAGRDEWNTSAHSQQAERVWWRSRRVLWGLELHQAHAVVGRVDEPGHPGEPDIGNTVLGLESWRVVVFDLHAAPAQTASLGPHIGDAEGSLRLLVPGPHAALGDH